MKCALALLASFVAACATSVDASVEELIERFRNPDIATRDRAEAELREIGQRAATALRAHLNDGDSEVASRCRRLLEAAVDDATWYESAAISGIELQAVTQKRLLKDGSDAEKHKAAAWFRTLSNLATTRASVLRAAHHPDGWHVEGLAGLVLWSDFLEVRFSKGEGPARLELMYDEAWARDDDPTLLALAFDYAGREGFDIELSWRGVISHRGIMSGPALRFCRRGDIFRSHWRPWHRGHFRP